VSPWTLRGPYDSRISDVWVYDYDSVFALISNPGYGSYVTEWDGHEWGDAKEIPTTSLIRSIWGLGPDDIFAVGVAATVMHFDGAEWTEFNNIGLDQWNSYSSIWGTSHNNLFVVGDWAPYSSSLQRFDGEWWSGIEVPTIQGLGSVVGWSDALHSMYLTDYEGGIYGYYIVIAGADEDLDWMTYSGEYPSYISSSTSSDSTMYLSGSSGVNSQLFTYNYGGTLQTSDIDLGVSPQPGLSDIVEHEGILYGVGTTGTQIVVYMRNLESGEESNFFDSMENTTYLTSAIAVANDGSIYVGGQTMGDIGDQSWSGFVNGTDLSSYYYDPYCFDAFVMKFTPDGERLWVQVYGTPDSPLPFGNRVGERVDHIQIDKVGNVIIAGSSSKIEPFVIGDPDHGGMGVSLGNIADRGTLANGYMYIAALDESGSPQKVLGYGTGGYDIISSLEATSDGKYYLVGYSNYGAIIGGNMGTGTYDTLVMKLDSNLETIWTRYIGEPKNQIVNDAAVGLDDSLYLTGSTGGPIGGQNYAGNRDIYISHFSSEGLLLATRVLGGTQGDTGLLIEVDRSGSPVIWASVTSPLVFGYKSNSYGVMWRVGEMMVDNSAECRLR